MTTADQRMLSRREALFGPWLRRARDQNLPSGSPSGAPPDARATAPPRVAVIQGRVCLVQRSLTCSVCAERCPVPGAIVRERGLPRIVADVCTGCGVCHDVCPAPSNAVLMLARRAAPRAGGA